MNDSEAKQLEIREMVNCQEIIGYAINRVSELHVKTQWAVVHYDKAGCHIIPALSDRYDELPTLPAAYALLAMQNALIGRVTPQLRAAVIAEIDLIFIRIYYDGAISNAQKKEWECVISETWADLGPYIGIDPKVERVDFPKKFPLYGRYAFLRKE